MPEGASVCPACGRSGPSAASFQASAAGSGTSTDSIEKLVAETKRAAMDLARASARVSERLLARAESATKGSGISAREAARKASKGLERARKEIERALDELK
jgi:hypothetical protein